MERPPAAGTMPGKRFRMTAIVADEGLPGAPFVQADRHVAAGALDYRTAFLALDRWRERTAGPEHQHLSMPGEGPDHLFQEFPGQASDHSPFPPFGARVDDPDFRTLALIIPLFKRNHPVNPGLFIVEGLQ